VQRFLTQIEVRRHIDQPIDQDGSHNRSDVRLECRYVVLKLRGWGMNDQWRLRFA
jgi:hypothetical protein